ncbi:MAG: type II CAAX prenyl endopeptidase Rce1 family protein [Pyrinomonadaceae bacterium]
MFELIAKLRDDIELLDRRAVIALVYAAFGLTAIFYFKNADFVEAAAKFAPALDHAAAWILEPHASNIRLLGYWAAVTMVFYVGLPAVIVRRMFRGRLADLGLSLRIEPGFWPLLAQCVAVMLPLVYWMSTTEGFASRYPFLKIYNGDPYIGWTLAVWELMYFLQFFGLEFFFRGFLIHSLKRSLGVYSVFVMTVPYTMIHLGKPMPEAFAAIVAGIFLGWLSYRTGNIWMGLVLHCTVALSMDILALGHKGLLF